MQLTLFKGLLPVNLPSSWFADQAAVAEIRYAKSGSRQAVDFRPVGGPILAFWVTYPALGQMVQHYEELQPEAAATLDWGTTDKHAFAVCSREVVKMFGQSGSVLDLTHLN